MEESSKSSKNHRLSLPKACWRLHRWCVSEHKHMSNACLSEGCPKSYRPLSISSTTTTDGFRRPRSPVKHSVLCKYKHVYYVTNCSTEVGKILFFLFFVEESSKRAAKTIACPCRKHVGGYTAGVCLNTNICLTHAPQRVARSRIVLSLFLQPIISYRVRLHETMSYGTEIQDS